MTGHTERLQIAGVKPSASARCYFHSMIHLPEVTSTGEAKAMKLAPPAPPQPPLSHATQFKDVVGAGEG